VLADSSFSSSGISDSAITVSSAICEIIILNTTNYVLPRLRTRFIELLLHYIDLLDGGEELPPERCTI
jgi:hypothetical protein